MVQSKGMKGRPLVLLVLSVLALAFTGALSALSEGDSVSNVQVRDASDKPSYIPHLGKKIVGIFYTDPDVADQNDPLADALSDADLKKKHFAGMGIVNMKDAPWTPDAAIRYIIRGKIKKYDSTILTDPSYILKNSWGLGDCDEKSVFILVGKDKKVLYYKKGPVRGSEIQRVISIIKENSK